MEHAAIYARLSRDPEGDKAAIARQLRDCRAYAQAKGWTVAQPFTDRDLSAFREDVERPEYEAMLEAIKAGDIDGVIVWKLDRLVRSPREFERFWKVCEDAGATLASVNDPVDTSSELGMVVTRMLVGFARMESVNISTRTKSAQADRADEGRHHGGGQRPYGWRRVKQADGPMAIEIEPEEAEHIREAVDAVLAGTSMRSLAAAWDERGIRSPNGRAWSGGTIRSMLLSPRLVGKRIHNGEVAGGGQMPVIVDPAKHAELVALLTDPSRSSGRRGQHYLLAGCIRCSCGAPMRTHVLRNNYRRYRCVAETGGCGKVFAKAEPLEEYVTAAVLAALPAIVARARKEAPPADLDQLDRDEKNLERLALDYYTEKITRAEFFGTRRALEGRIKAARERLATRRGARVVDATVAERWPRMTFDERRTFVDAVLEAVVIRPASVRGRRAFEYERVSFVWKA